MPAASDSRKRENRRKYRCFPIHNSDFGPDRMILMLPAGSAWDRFEAILTRKLTVPRKRALQRKSKPKAFVWAGYCYASRV
jgi:hypothetical protein